MFPMAFWKKVLIFGVSEKVIKKEIKIEDKFCFHKRKITRIFFFDLI